MMFCCCWNLACSSYFCTALSADFQRWKSVRHGSFSNLFSTDALSPPFRAAAFPYLGQPLRKVRVEHSCPAPDRWHCICWILFRQDGAILSESPQTPCTVVVLGCKVKGTVPSLMLQRRLEAAKDYLQQHPDIPALFPAERERARTSPKHRR